MSYRDRAIHEARQMASAARNDPAMRLCLIDTIVSAVADCAAADPSFWRNLEAGNRNPVDAIHLHIRARIDEATR